MPSVRPIAAAIAVATAYLVGMKVGSALTVRGSPISTLWPPNALLMAALLVSPRRLWPLFLAVLLPAHILFQRKLGLPLGGSLGWFVGNTGEALLGAVLLRRSRREGRLFETCRDVIRFVLFGALLAPIVTSFWDAAVAVSTGLGSDYWSVFSVRLFSNIIAILLFVPPVVLAFEGGLGRLRRSSSIRLAEAAALGSSALLVAFLVDLAPVSLRTIPLELYAPLPIFLWAALRFGPWESSLAVLAVTLVEIWNLTRGRGPFASGSAAENVLSLQTYSVLVAIPILLFAVAMEERRRAERRLRRNEERLELAFAVSRMSNWDWDLRSGELFFSARQLGFQPVSLDPDLPFLFGVVHPEDRPEVLRIHEEAVGNRGSYEVECRVFDEKGDVHWVLRKAQVVTDRTGQPVRVFGVTQDITDRKKSEEALAESQKISSLARNAGKIAIWSLDADTGEIYAERLLPTLLGFEAAADRASLDFWLSRIYEPDRARIIATKNSVLDPGASIDEHGETPIPELEYRIRHADGSLRWFLTRATVVRRPDGSPRRIVGTAIDVTERKRADLEAQEERRQLTHLARVSALGELSGALAHELNQPLTSILSNAEAAKLLIERDSSDVRELGRILDDIVAEDRRAGEVIRRLRSLLRKGAGQVQKLDVSQVVQETLNLMRGDLVTRNVTLTTSLPSGLPDVDGDPVQLQQVLLNLILNACDAMSENRGDDRALTVSTFGEASVVVVAVKDSGSGIRAEHMELLFRPFFTTKNDGLGLGLAICQSIIRAGGGRLWAENNPDRGATFRFELPSANLQKPRKDRRSEQAI